MTGFAPIAPGDKVAFVRYRRRYTGYVQRVAKTRALVRWAKGARPELTDSWMRLSELERVPHTRVTRRI